MHLAPSARRWLLRSLALASLLTASAASLPAASPAMPRYGQWTSAYIGGGGWLQEIILCPSDPRRMYSYVDIGGVYRSDDGGETWRMLHGGLPGRRGDYDTRAVHVDPRNADILLAALSIREQQDTVYRSTDGGLTWKIVISGAPFYGNINGRYDGRLIIHKSDDPDQLLIATAGGNAYRSSDNGVTWTKHRMPGKIFATGLLADRRDPARVWLWARAGEMGGSGWSIGTYEGGLFESGDFGATWEKISDDYPTKMIQDPLDAARFYAIFDDSEVRVSTDDARSWKLFSDGLALEDEAKRREKKHKLLGDAYYHALDAGSDFIVLGSAKGSFYRLRCGESTWRKVERQAIVEPEGGWSQRPGGQMFGWACGWMRVDPRDPNHWFFTDWYAMYQSRDAGATWRLTVHGVESTYIHSILADPAEPARVHLGMSDNGYFRSLDGGQSFRRGGPELSSNIKWLDLSPKDPRRLVAVGTPGGEWICNQVFLSADSGVNWRKSPMTGLPPDLEKRRIVSITVDPATPDTLYLPLSGNVAPGEGGPYRSRDGGDTWEWIGEGLPKTESFFTRNIWAHTGQEIQVGAGGELLATSSFEKTLWHRGPGSAAWRAVDFPVKGQKLYITADPHQARRFYAAASGDGIWRSDDSAATWTRLRQTKVVELVADRARPGRLAYADRDTVWFSADGGETWIDLDPERGLPHRPVNVLSFVGDRLYTGTTGSGVLWRTLP